MINPRASTAPISISKQLRNRFSHLSIQVSQKGRYFWIPKLDSSLSNLTDLQFVETFGTPLNIEETEACVSAFLRTDKSDWHNHYKILFFYIGAGVVLGESESFYNLAGKLESIAKRKPLLHFEFFKCIRIGFDVALEQLIAKKEQPKTFDRMKQLLFEFNPDIAIVYAASLAYQLSVKSLSWHGSLWEEGKRKSFYESMLKRWSELTDDAYPHSALVSIFILASIGNNCGIHWTDCIPFRGPSDSALWNRLCNAEMLFYERPIDEPQVLREFQNTSKRNGICANRLRLENVRKAWQYDILDDECNIDKISDKMKRFRLGDDKIKDFRNESVRLAFVTALKFTGIMNHELTEFDEHGVTNGVGRDCLNLSHGYNTVAAKNPMHNDVSVLALTGVRLNETFSLEQVDFPAGYKNIAFNYSCAFFKTLGNLKDEDTYFHHITFAKGVTACLQIMLKLFSSCYQSTIDANGKFQDPDGFDYLLRTTMELFNMEMKRIRFNCDKEDCDSFDRHVKCFIELLDLAIVKADSSNLTGGPVWQYAAFQKLCMKLAHVLNLDEALDVLNRLHDGGFQPNSSTTILTLIHKTATMNGDTFLEYCDENAPTRYQGHSTRKWALDFMQRWSGQDCFSFFMSTLSMTDLMQLLVRMREFWPMNSINSLLKNHQYAGVVVGSILCRHMYIDYFKRGIQAASSSFAKMVHEFRLLDDIHPCLAKSIDLNTLNVDHILSIMFSNLRSIASFASMFMKDFDALLTSNDYRLTQIRCVAEISRWIRNDVKNIIKCFDACNKKLDSTSSMASLKHLIVYEFFESFRPRFPNMVLTNGGGNRTANPTTRMIEGVIHSLQDEGHARLPQLPAPAAPAAPAASSSNGIALPTEYVEVVDAFLQAKRESMRIDQARRPAKYNTVRNALIQCATEVNSSLTRKLDCQQCQTGDCRMAGHLIRQKEVYDYLAVDLKVVPKTIKAAHVKEFVTFYVTNAFGVKMIQKDTECMDYWKRVIRFTGTTFIGLRTKSMLEEDHALKKRLCEFRTPGPKKQKNEAAEQQEEADDEEDEGM